MKRLSKIFLGMIAASLVWALPLSADSVTTTTTTTTTYNLRDDAPIYWGPVVETQLEPLTLSDFQTFGTKPSAAFDEYQKYDIDGRNPELTGPRLYKMKVSRDLTLVDFQGPGISADVAAKRYQTYLAGHNLKPGDSYYVYVYHTPVVVAVRQ